MKMRASISELISHSLLALALAAGPALAEKKYGPGVTDTEIKIGQTMPYSGRISFYSTTGKVEAAYFNQLDSEGGINGRRITLLSLDDGYNPGEAVVPLAALK
jgi:branched-chain amino acid transport system substrate-binding protein